MAKEIQVERFSQRSLRACRVEKPTHGGDAIGRNAYEPGVFLDGRLVWREIHAVHLVARYVAMEPLDLVTHSPQNADRLSRDFPPLGVA